jgi:large subunit ribosomal protein L25
MTISLTAEKRTTLGRKVDDARKEGKLPAVLYGRKEASTPLYLSLSEFLRVWKAAGETSIVSVSIGGDVKDVLIHDISYDPVRDLPIHVDLYAVEKDKVLQVHVPLEYVGVAPGVKELGGTLVKVLHEVEVETLPANIPHSFEVDISGLSQLESHFTAGELALPRGVTLITPPDEILALIAKPTEETEETSTEAPDFSKIEVEKKGKKEEEGDTAAESA